MTEKKTGGQYLLKVEVTGPEEKVFRIRRVMVEVRGWKINWKLEL